MKKYFLKNEAGQEGPFTPEELLGKGIGPDTPVWYEGLENWTTAGQIDELRNLFPVDLCAGAMAAAEPPEEPVPAQETANTEPAPVEAEAATPVVATATIPPVPAPETVSPAAATAQAPGTPLPVRKKGNAVISWVLSLAVLGGTGFYVYQDIQKNKDNTGSMTLNENRPEAENTTGDQTADADNNGSQTVTTSDSLPVTDTAAILPVTTEPATTEKAAEDDKKKQAALIAAKKKEEEKKKLAAAEAKKKEEERKRIQAAEALAAKEMEMRNKWAKYVTMGSFQIEGDDKVKPFEIPVYNGYAYPLEKVTLRVDYLKKERIVATETLTLTNIPAKGGLKANATGNKKGKTANVYITGASSRGLHFCYPSTGGKSGDPYYCN